MHEETRPSFHESDVIFFGYEDAAVVLCLADVQGGEHLRSAVIRLDGIRSIVCDDTAVSEIVREHEDGEVLTLELSEKELYVIIEWHNFQPLTIETHAYRITCDQAACEIRENTSDGSGA